MIATRDDSTSPISVAAPANDPAHLPLAFGKCQLAAFFLSALRSPIRGALCERRENDCDEGPENLSPRNRDGTRHAGFPGLMHASLLTDCLVLLSFYPDSHTPLIQFPGGVKSRSRTKIREGVHQVEQPSWQEGKWRARQRGLILRRDPTSVPRSCRLTRQDATQHPPRPTVLVIRPVSRRTMAAPLIQGAM